MTIALISHPDCLLHDPGESHPERPGRVLAIQKALEKYPFKVPVQFYEAPLASEAQLLLAHEEGYVKWIQSIAPKAGLIGIDQDTLMNAHTYPAALRAAGAVCDAVDLLMSDKAQVAFCNIRPPGHHAEKEKAMGFCFFNNLAIGVRHALENYGLNRIAIVDFDAHHGNGTQSIFQNDKRVLFCSSFEHPFYPGYEGEMDNDHIISLPLKAGTAGPEYREKVAEVWLPKIRAFEPELIFISAGFDSHAKDPLANLALQAEDYVWLSQRLAEIAKQYCQGKIISVLEGGYNARVLAECVPVHVEAMCG